ncbi:hypothetical protein [Streptomyces acidiscabies]|uniref:Uncharacterized protein n=1 Tax=Streptomyces acidiscabies TaxID=42234 RepID=A0AAP6BCW6_9ACTN|nr:hypothetical protein [Streptomyces acidiscabies]MBZ3909422.1 hypothetical protein [Streptomyces acidiscabies]MDX2962411.1 hypothetical protein [Streptomyces acidiscabies]MDX3792430.1 hypothetical protein [Streptomyces acidiscabies]
MAATTSGAIKAYLESLSFGVPVFRDGPREGQAEPYVVVQEGIPAGLDTIANGDFGDPNAEINIAETVIVDLVQRARVQTGAATTKVTERYGLAEAIAHALHGCTLPAHPAKVTAVRVQDIDRIPIEDNRVRHSITVTVRRTLLRDEVTP